MAAALRAFGAPPEEIEEWRKVIAAREPDAFEVLPENRAAVLLFVALGTQWRRAGVDGIRVGLDYTAIGPTAGLMGQEMSPRLFADLRTLEQAALEAMEGG